MGIQVFAGSDSSLRRISLIEHVAEQGKGATVVARNAAVQHWLGRELARVGRRAITVMSWQAWVDALWLAMGDGRSIVDAATRAALIVEMLAEFNLPGDQRGALELVGGRRLLAEVLEELGGEDLPGATESYRHYAAAIDAYRALAAVRGYVERAEAVEIVAGRTAPVSSPIAFVGFSDLTTRETDLLVSLAGRGNIAIELALGEEPAGVLAGNAAALAQFETVGLEIIRTAPHTAPRPSALVDHLWGSPSAEALGDLARSGAVTYGLAEGTPSEVVLVVDRVVEELARGTNPDEIAVIFRKSKAIAPTVAAEMERRSVPHAVVESVPFEATGLGAAFATVLRAAGACQADPAQPGAPLIGPFLTSAYAGIERNRAVQLDARARQRRLGIGEVFRLAKWYTVPAEGGRPEKTDLTVIGRAQRAAEQDGTSELALDAKVVADMLAANARATGVSTWWAERQDEAAHRAITDTVASLLDAGAPLTIAVILRALEGATVMVSARPNTRGRVTIAGATKVSGRTFEAVVLGGLADADYATQLDQTPAQRIREGLGLPDAPDAQESEDLMAAELLSTARERLHLVWRTHDSRGEELVGSPLLNKIHAAIGTPIDFEADPSRIGSVARRRLSDPEVIASRCHARAERMGEYRAPAHAAPLVAARGTDAVEIPSSYWDGRDLSPSQIELYGRCPYSWFLTRFLRPAELDTTFGAREEGVMVHRILERFYERWVRELGNGALSAEQLPTARPIFDEIAREESELAIAQMESGDGGAVVEGSEAGEGEGGGEGPANAQEGEAAELSGSAALQAVELGLIVEAAWSRLAADAVMPYGLESRKHAAGLPTEMAPEFFEWKFGSQARREAEANAEANAAGSGAAESDLDLYLDPVVVGGVSLTGSIDRIDTALVTNADTGAVERLIAVVDYKGSVSNYPPAGKLLEQGYIQAPIYLLAAERALNGLGIYAGYSSYGPNNKALGVSDGRTADGPAALARGERDAAFAVKLAELEELVGTIAQGMADGNIAPSPDITRNKNAGCKYCAHFGCAFRNEGW